MVKVNDVYYNSTQTLEIINVNQSYSKNLTLIEFLLTQKNIKYSKKAFMLHKNENIEKKLVCKKMNYFQKIKYLWNKQKYFLLKGVKGE